jgi:DNA polymerase
MTHTKQEQLNALYQPFNKQSSECILYCSGHTHIVFGEGNPNADIMFIGEAPGKDEDIQGRPFVGRSGKLLTQVLHNAGIKREDVFITNIVKCRPPFNKTPIIKDIPKSTLNLLRKQIQIIQPKILVTLGSIAAKVILNEQHLKITHARGKIFTKGNFKIISIYHPAYILRNQNLKKIWEQDIHTIKDEVNNTNTHKKGINI